MDRRATGGLLVFAHLGAGKLLVKGQDGPHASRVGVPGAAATRVEASGAGGGRGGRRRGHSAWRSSGRRAEEVAQATAPGLRVAVLGDGWVWLSEGVVGRHPCAVVSLVLCFLWYRGEVYGVVHGYAVDNEVLFVIW